jgi:outer membrane receptor for ferric coprogen and ferric-rhodotorulic acid
LLGVFCIGVAQAQNSDSQPAPASSSSEEETVLPTVTVSAQSERDPATEGTGSYTTGATTTTTKLPLTLRETPQSITVITRQQMDDFGLNTIGDVLENTSSVHVERRRFYTVYESRGYQMQNKYDGIANPRNTEEGQVSASAIPPDSAFLDHVEVQQGAAGLLTGAGLSGGTINLVRKRPTETFQAQVEAEFGSWDKKRLVGDISGPLIQSGLLRGRAVVVSDESNSFIDYVYGNKKAFYGILEIAPSADTKIDLGLQYQKDRYRPSYGVPVIPGNGRDLGLSRSTYFRDPYRSSENGNLSAFLYFEQKLPGDWVIKADYAHSQLDKEVFGTSLGGTLNSVTGDGLSISRFREVFKIEADTVDTYVSGPAQFFGRRHEFALGVNGSKHTFCSTYKDTGPDVPINIYTHHPSDLPAYGKPSLDCDADGVRKTRQHGVWGVARLNIADPLKVILGARVSWYDYRDGIWNVTMKENGVFSPYGGIVYDLNKQFSVYASYSDIFESQNAKDRTGNVLKPVVGSNYEIGIKGEFLNKRLNAAAAIFRLEQTNLAEVDENFGISPLCDDWYCYNAAGKVISQGVDLSLNGALSSNWNINLGYTFTNHEYATGESKGERYDPCFPKQIFRISTTYKIPGSSWTVGGNLRAQSGIYSTSGVTTIKQSGFALLGLMAKYQINTQAEVRITANNVFDRKYRYPNMLNYTHYGEPRSIFASVKYTF